MSFHVPNKHRLRSGFMGSDERNGMCQRHHLAHDHDHHRANAQATRRAKAGTAELF